MPDWQARGGIKFSGCLSVRPFVCPSVRSSITKFVNIILKTSKPILMTFRTSGPRRKDMKYSSLGNRRSKATVA